VSDNATQIPTAKSRGLPGCKAEGFRENSACRRGISPPSSGLSAKTGSRQQAEVERVDAAASFPMPGPRSGGVSRTDGQAVGYFCGETRQSRMESSKAYSVKPCLNQPCELDCPSEETAVVTKG
jgi:hypothetical protein